MSGHRSHAHAVETEGETIHWARGYDWLLQAATFGLEGRIRARILDAAEVRAGDRVLDVGCGTGTLALLAVDRVGEGGTVEGVDPAPEMIARARAKAKRRGIDASFREAAVEALPFAEATFDVVLSSLMYHHLPRPLQLVGLGELKRVLAPGGRLCIVDFDGGGPVFHRLAAHLAAHHHEDEHAGLGFEALAEEARRRGFEQIRVDALRPRFLRVLRAEVPRGG